MFSTFFFPQKNFIIIFIIRVVSAIGFEAVYGFTEVIRFICRLAPYGGKFISSFGGDSESAEPFSRWVDTPCAGWPTRDHSSTSLATALN